jgi:hypothetical protein
MALPLVAALIATSVLVAAVLVVNLLGSSLASLLLTGQEDWALAQRTRSRPGSSPSVST